MLGVVFGEFGEEGDYLLLNDGSVEVLAEASGFGGGCGADFRFMVV